MVKNNIQENRQSLSDQNDESKDSYNGDMD